MRLMLFLWDWLFADHSQPTTVEQWRQVWAAPIIKPKREAR
jgi:hypothetical protein